MHSPNIQRLDPVPRSGYKDRALMKKFWLAKATFLIPGALGLLAVVAFVLWIGRGATQPLTLRVPGTDQAPGSEGGAAANPVLAGKLVRADGQPATLPGAWPSSAVQPATPSALRP